VGDYGIIINLALGDTVMVIPMGASPILGIIRGVKNGDVIHAVVSMFVPFYGLIYFFSATQPRK
jgi:hypothetical protein